MRKFIIVVTLLMASSAAFAQDQPAAGPCDGALFRQFDFWVGDWDVFDQEGQQVGTNSIAIEEKGCLLVERWTDRQGNTGQSYNFVDHTTGKWRQVWVNPGVVIDYAGGLDENGAMDLQGTLAVINTEPQKYRGTWSLQEDGTVHQHLRQFDTEKGEWAAGFTGVYKKKTQTDD